MCFTFGIHDILCHYWTNAIGITKIKLKINSYILYLKIQIIIK